MKKKSAVWLLGIFLAFFNVTSFAQNPVTTVIDPYRLAITHNKTTNLIFPYSIKSIDKGSRDILVQKALGVENVLQLKAGKLNFTETNLTVVTADGSLFSYILNYGNQPTGINIKVDNPQLKPQSIAVFTKDATNDIIQRNAERIVVKRKSVNGLEDNSFGSSICIKGLFIENDMLYFQIVLKNFSAIDYDIKMLRFFIKDKKKSKRTASQEIEVTPIYVLGNTKVIRSQSEQTIVVAVSKFTIPDKKAFMVQMQEEYGGRNLGLKISNKEIFKARII